LTLGQKDLSVATIPRPLQREIVGAGALRDYYYASADSLGGKGRFEFFCRTEQHGVKDQDSLRYVI
jgi:hypothetical protein